MEANEKTGVFPAMNGIVNGIPDISLKGHCTLLERKVLLASVFTGRSGGVTFCATEHHDDGRRSTQMQKTQIEISMNHYYSMI